jgi:Uma2 family endonuclease
MADNPLQYEWNSTIKWCLETQFDSELEVFVAGDHLIYPVEGNRKIRIAPDAYVAFGVVKGYRGSYKVWEEHGIFPQVVFEVWSPGNRPGEMEEKKAFYERYGAEEYYILYPETPASMEGWLRQGPSFVPIANMNGFVSPRLGIRFVIENGEVSIFGPDGREFENPTEIAKALKRAEQEAAHERERAEAESLRREQFAAKLRELGVDPDSI